jgi:hypothetical protein
MVLRKSAKVGIKDIESSKATKVVAKEVARAKEAIAIITIPVVMIPSLTDTLEAQVLADKNMAAPSKLNLQKGFLTISLSKKMMTKIMKCINKLGH